MAGFSYAAFGIFAIHATPPLHHFHSLASHWFFAGLSFSFKSQAVCNRAFQYIKKNKEDIPIR